MQVLVHGRFYSGAVPPDNSLPLTFTTRQLTLHNSPWINTSSNQVPLSITIAECFHLSLFESEFHITEATIATQDPSRGGIAYSCDHFLHYSIGSVLLIHEIKMKFFSALFRTHFYRHQQQHVYLKCGNPESSYKIKLQFRSRNLANMCQMLINGVPWSLPNKVSQVTGHLECLMCLGYLNVLNSLSAPVR